ncbi:acyloxyacyl hydrolase [Myxococcota bacterium]|nr:acyloxyacyl hydrolase [Myxococcota bacterium]
MRRLARFALTLLMATGIQGLAARAGSEPGGPPRDPNPSSPFAAGQWLVGTTVGYAWPFQLYDGTSDVEDSEFVAILPRAGLGLTDPLGGDSWYRGNVELGMEGHFLIQTQPHSGSAYGAAFLGRYNLLALEAHGVVPFVELGAGLVSLDFDLQRRADGANFILEGGAGLHWFIWRRTALTAQWRYHHISNGRIEDPNVGVDSGLALVGFTVALGPAPGELRDESASRAATNPRHSQ